MAQVKLKKLAVLEGDLYHPGIYEERELPPIISNNPDLVTQIDSQKDSSLTEYDNSLKVQKVNIGEQLSNTNSPPYKSEEAVVLTKNSQEKPTDTSSKTAINFNTATLDEIAGINGITMPTAQKIVEERDKSKFSDFSDLETRISLPGKRKWESFKDSVIFD